MVNSLLEKMENKLRVFCTPRRDLVTPTIKPLVEVDTSDYIIIPALNIAVSPARIAYDSGIKEIEKTTERKFPNTATDLLRREYIGNIKPQEAITLNFLRGTDTPSILQEVNFLNLLYQGMNRKVLAYNLVGKQLDPEYLEKVFNDIVQVNSPLRAEWLDTFFELRSTWEAISVLTQNKTKVEKLDFYTMMNYERDRISLEGWLRNPTKQGLPSTSVESGDLTYGRPECERFMTATSFFAGPYGHGLCCNKINLGYTDCGVRSMINLDK